MDNVILSPAQKALNINLHENIYGTFSEIGAGQEVVRHFFRSGGASGTIAKAMSAYDMDVSDAIYGKEEDGRYVCESRLKKMINKLIKPHGGSLINCYCNDTESNQYKNDAVNYQSWTLTDRQLCDLELILNGAFSPLDGFMNQQDYNTKYVYINNIPSE